MRLLPGNGRFARFAPADTDLPGLPESATRAVRGGRIGGHKQRVTIAMTLAAEPGFLVADGPASALGVPAQASLAAVPRPGPVTSLA